MNAFIEWIVKHAKSRIYIALFAMPARFPRAQVSLTVALPYITFLVADRLPGVSQVIAVVMAGMTLNLLGPGRLSPVNWSNLREVWDVLPLLTALRLSPHVDRPNRVSILWGGLRGTVTLALALLSRKVRRTQATALSHSTLLILDEVRFRRLLKRNKTIREAVRESAKQRGLKTELLSMPE
ncbi:MAG: hypothetical protein JJU08_03190 [Rhodobacteraceae bacterium]|nr:hypothetical protein [Paracoccaceae bacterium]